MNDFPDDGRKVIASTETKQMAGFRKTWLSVSEHIVQLSNVTDWEKGQVTFFWASQFVLIESGYSGAGGGCHRRLQGGNLLSIPQVSQHVLELRPVWSWRRRVRRRKENMGDRNQRRKQKNGVRKRRRNDVKKRSWGEKDEKCTLAKWRQNKSQEFKLSQKGNEISMKDENKAEDDAAAALQRIRQRRWSK